MTPAERSQRIAYPGTIWMCAACCKTATDRYGIEGDKSPGWDESCVLNAILVDKLTHRPIAQHILNKIAQKAT